jgi:excisionase family DNA binding protein
MKPVRETSVTAREIADYFGVTAQTVYRWMKNGQIPAVRIGSTVRVRRDDFERLKTPAPPPTAA